MEFFCGRGFITMDGDVWQHSRKSPRPSFAKHNIADLNILSRKVGDLLTQLPKDGETIDLQPLLYIVVRAPTCLPPILFACVVLIDIHYGFTSF